MNLSKEQLLASLPLRKDNIAMRACDRADIDEMAKWPLYPFPYEAFNAKFAGMTCEQRDEYYYSRRERADRVTLVCDDLAQPTIVDLALRQVDWACGAVGNFGYRVRPDWCDKGIGTFVMRITADWLFRSGFSTLRLDVVAGNGRAIRCYEKAGFAITGEFWKEEEGLKHTPIDRPEYDWLRPHVRMDAPVPLLRFWWMELTA